MALLTTGQFIGLLVFLFGLGFYWLIILVIVGALKYSKTDPKYEGIWYNDDGTVKDRRAIKPTGYLSSSWQEKHPNPLFVKFKVFPRGIGKGEEREWRIADMWIKRFGESDKQIIHFNMVGLHQAWAFEKNHLSTTNRQLVVENNNLWNENKELKARRKESVEELATLAHKFTPKFYQPPRKQLGGPKPENG